MMKDIGSALLTAATVLSAGLAPAEVLTWVEQKESVSVRNVRGYSPKPKGEGESKIRVACIGDSITYGYAMTNRLAECYPAQLQRLLGDDYEVRNFGDSGSCVYLSPKVAKGQWCPHPWRLGAQAKEAYAFHPDIVISNLGINDEGIYMNEYIRPDDSGQPVVETGLFRCQYLDLLRQFETEGVRPRFIIWTRLAPLSKGHRSKLSPARFVMERDLDLVASAMNAMSLDMYTPLLPYAETPHFAADGIHPEGGAQRIIAEVTARAVRAGERRVRPL